MNDANPEAGLDSLRNAIDELDIQILELVARRISVVLKIAEYKRARGLPVYDAERERCLIDRLCERSPAPLDRDTVRHVFERLIDESRRMEQQHLHMRGADGPHE